MSDPVSFGNGRYSVIHKLGEGGMAVVYLAVDNRLLRPVAIKVPHPELLWRGKDKLVRRFGQETVTMARATHPHTVTLYDAGAEQIDEALRTPYLVMEFVGGVSLEDMIKLRSKSKFGALPPRIACHMILGTLSALVTLHNGGLIHRDIKPANIMIGWDGKVVKLMDFGIARMVQDAMSDEDRNTRTGVMGTLHYMAPEQMRNTKDADARADIYSAGATLHAILTGKEPEQIRSELHNLMDNDAEFTVLPDGLREIVIGATRLYPEERVFQTAEAMREAIENVVPSLPKFDQKFASWLESKRDASAAESALRRAFGVGYTMVPEAEAEGVKTGFTQWFESGPDATAQPAAVTPADPEPVAVIRLTRKPWRMIAGVIGVILVGVAIGVSQINMETSEPPMVAVTETREPIPGPTPTVAVTETHQPIPGPTPTVAVTETRQPKVGKKDVERVAEVAVAVPVPIPAPVLVPDPPAPDTGTVRLSSGAVSIQLVGSDGSTHQEGKPLPGVYRISAMFETKGTVANAGDVTVIAGSSISLACNEKFAKCMPR